MLFDFQPLALIMGIGVISPGFIRPTFPSGSAQYLLLDCIACQGLEAWARVKIGAHLPFLQELQSLQINGVLWFFSHFLGF